MEFTAQCRVQGYGSDSLRFMSDSGLFVDVPYRSMENGVFNGSTIEVSYGSDKFTYHVNRPLPTVSARYFNSAWLTDSDIRAYEDEHLVIEKSDSNLTYYKVVEFSERELKLFSNSVSGYLNSEWLMLLCQYDKFSVRYIKYDKLIIVCNSVIDDISELNKSLRTCLSLYLSNFDVTIYSLSSTRFSNGLVAVSLVLRRRSNG